MRTKEKNLTSTVLAAAVLVVFGCSSEEAPNARESTRPVNRTVTNRTLSSSETRPEPPKPAGPASFADGEAAYHARNYAEARRVFQQYTEETPDNAWGHYMLGLSAWKEGDLTGAEPAFEEALSLDPDHYKSLFNLSRVLLEQRRFDETIVRLTHLAEIGFESPELNRLFGRAYQGLGMTDHAAAAYRRAIALDAEDAWSMNNLGYLYLELGRPYDALPPLARAVELRKDEPMFFNNLGMALEHTGRFTAAAAVYGSALEADPGYGKAQVNLARVQVVEVNGEEPFDLAQTAARFADEFTAVEEVAEEAIAPTLEEVSEDAPAPAAGDAREEARTTGIEKVSEEAAGVE